MGENPFEVLRLDPSATEEEIVRQAGRLRQRATDEAAHNAIRRAVQALTARAEDRLLFALLSHPSPCYHAPALDRFAVAFRRPPAAANDTANRLALDRKEFETLLIHEWAEEMELPPQSFEPLTAGADAAEIHRQTSEALWQSLLFNPLG